VREKEREGERKEERREKREAREEKRDERKEKVLKLRPRVLNSTYQSFGTAIIAASCFLSLSFFVCGGIKRREGGVSEGEEEEERGERREKREERRERREQREEIKEKVLKLGPHVLHSTYQSFSTVIIAACCFLSLSLFGMWEERGRGRGSGRE
jgi:hypothetical protein